MKPERWHRIEQLCQSTLDREPAQRTAFLDQACAGDEELRREVESLLAYQGRAEPFIETPALRVAAGLLAEEKTQSLVGQSFSHYQVLALLSRGGMGEVYLAQDEQLRRKVALKVLPAEFTQDEDRLRRFEQEARAASALNHPNIITIHEIGHADQWHYIITEFVEGRTLRQQMSDGRMKLPVALAVVAQVASALASAHAAGIVHRDIKPENIMLRPDGLVKVLDFGLAKLTESQARTIDAQAMTLAAAETEPGRVMGTARYMSPEQARGLKVDARSDIFSLGVVLYEMVAGSSPFEGATMSDVIAAILGKEPVPLVRCVPETPTELDRIVTKALCKDREERYQGVKDLLVDLKHLRQELETESKKERAATSSEVVAPTTSSAEYIVGEIKRHKRGALLALAALVIAVAAAVYFATSGKAIDSVAILPFVNVGNNPDTEFLSDGITESLISHLSQLPQLNVKPRHSILRYKGQNLDPQIVASELKVQAVLTGRVEPRGDSLTISLELIDVRNNRQLWGGQYNYKLADLPRVQTEISQEIAEKLRLRLSGAEQQKLAKHYTQDAEAYQLLLKGDFHLYKLTEDGARNAIPYFQQALAKDPRYALAYVGLSRAYIQLGTDVLPPKEALLQAKDYALKALELDGALAEAHASLGIVKLLYDWDWAAAERELKPNLSLRLSPQSVETYTCVLHYTDPLGRNDEAIAEIKQALMFNPLSLIMNLELGCASYYGHDYDQAIKQFKETLALDQNSPPAYFGLGRAYGQEKKYTEAIAELEKGKTISHDSPLIVAELGYAYAASGQKERARKVIQELNEQAAHRYVDPYLFALVYVGLGEKDQVFAWLEKAYDARSGFMPWLKVEPKWNDLHSDPRFADLLRRVGLTP